MAASWAAPFVAAGIDRTDVVHLHHLTAQHDAVARSWPHVPRVVQLHGTELKFLEALDARLDVARRLGHSLATMPEAAREGALDLGPLDTGERELLAATRWAEWRHGEYWRAHLVSQARAADHVVTVSSLDRATALSLFGIEPERVTAIPNGVDADLFAPMVLSGAARRACFHHWLVDEPRGWDASGRPGSVTYTDADVDRLVGPDDDNLVLLYVGRFTGAKRVPLLVRAFAKARTRAGRPVSLVIWGGHPGEWEGEHPFDVARAVGGEGIYFTGWRGHDDLPGGLAAADALVMSSVNDSFPGTVLEAMAVGRPVIATLSGGFPSMVNVDPVRPTGWLVPPDDVDALADALVAIVHDRAELARRGANALTYARRNLTWAGRVAAFETAYDCAIEHRRTAGAGPGAGQPA